MTRDLLALQAATLFVLSPAGRIARLNSPDSDAPPRMYLSGCAEGWTLRLRHDVDAATVAEIEGLAAQEAPVTAPGATPRFAERYRALLGGGALSLHNYGPIHLLPQGTVWTRDAVIVAQGTPEGDALTARIARDGMPAALVEAGFADLSHFWAPWCVALADGEIAAVAFAARLSPRAAEIGVYTLKAFRGRGFAAAATAAWSTMPVLQERTLFYSTHRDNLPSQRVIARLGLPFLGESMRLL
jgi:RimJ/RimL family protein N-acetyltransferase